MRTVRRWPPGVLVGHGLFWDFQAGSHFVNLILIIRIIFMDIYSLHQIVVCAMTLGELEKIESYVPQSDL